MTEVAGAGYERRPPCRCTVMPLGESETTADRLRRIADEDIGGNAPWLADELREVARKLELEWAGTYTGNKRCACWEICPNDSEPDSDMCADCLAEGCPGGRGDDDE